MRPVPMLRSGCKAWEGEGVLEVDMPRDFPLKRHYDRFSNKFNFMYELPLLGEYMRWDRRYRINSLVGTMVLLTFLFGIWFMLMDRGQQQFKVLMSVGLPLLMLGWLAVLWPRIARARLHIDREHWSLERRWMGAGRVVAEGRAWEIEGFGIEQLDQQRRRYFSMDPNKDRAILTLESGGRRIELSSGLSTRDAERIIELIEGVVPA